jgi:hypothetical protein
MQPHLNQKLGKMVHTSHPSCVGDRDQEDHGSRPTLAKKVHKTPFPPIAGCCGTRVIPVMMEA